ncbi:hypothetical protein F2Q70_00000762 [Brassica cretica]|uniref:Uncharacterized protein n=1 Tax=Brassica cretica TaxID=69181 RepID=A0A8S9IL22_BRACR|nr:hypothetical protein F2Q70_00000762 [Brassica cretica]
MQIVREEEGWPDSTSYGQDSLKGRGFLSSLGTHANIQCRKWFHGSSMEWMMGATHEWILSIPESVGSDLMALNHGLGRFRKDVYGLSRAIHDQDSYDPGRFIGF